MPTTYYKDANQAQREFIERRVRDEVYAPQTELVNCLLRSRTFAWSSIYNFEPGCAGVQEWLLCSEWLADKLKEHGQPALVNDYGSWWGRTTSGQSVALGGLFWELFAESVNTLEGAGE